MKIEEEKDHPIRIPPTRETITEFNLVFETIVTENGQSPKSCRVLGYLPNGQEIYLLKTSSKDRNTPRKTVILQREDDGIINEIEYLYFRDGNIEQYEYFYPISEFNDENYLRKSEESTVAECEGIKLWEDLGFTFVSEAKLGKLIDLLKIAVF